jgi:hypothetical protein
MHSEFKVANKVLYALKFPRQSDSIYFNYDASAVPFDSNLKLDTVEILLKLSALSDSLCCAGVEPLYLPQALRQAHLNFTNSKAV